jgi:hypothetical protein
MGSWLRNDFSVTWSARNDYDLRWRWPSRLVATAEEDSCRVELQTPKPSAGRFTLQAL